jgi:hypothetical protein
LMRAGCCFFQNFACSCLRFLGSRPSSLRTAVKSRCSASSSLRRTGISKYSCAWTATSSTLLHTHAQRNEQRRTEERGRRQPSQAYAGRPHGKGRRGKDRRTHNYERRTQTQCAQKRLKAEIGATPNELPHRQHRDHVSEAPAAGVPLPRQQPLLCGRPPLLTCWPGWAS